MPFPSWYCKQATVLISCAGPTLPAAGLILLVFRFCTRYVTHALTNEGGGTPTMGFGSKSPNGHGACDA